MFRIPPASVTFAGPPGCGKSYLSMIVAQHLAFLDGFSVESIHSRNIFSEHWDGYAGEKIILYDDVHCNSQDPSATTYKELISLISCNPYTPPFAALNLKGDYVSPRYVIMSTNYPYPDYLCCSDAVCRRSGRLIYCVPNKLKREPDFSHLNFYMLPNPLRQTFVSPIEDPNAYSTVDNFMSYHPLSSSSMRCDIPTICRAVASDYKKNLLLHSDISIVNHPKRFYE